MKIKDLDRLSRLRESANDSARNFRTVYVSYLVIALYIFSVVMFSDEEELFRDRDLQIVIINLGVPISLFFTFSPLVILALHFNLLIQAMFLARKVNQYASTIRSLLLSPSNGEMEMLDLLFPAPLAHMIAGRDFDGTSRNLLFWIVILTVIILPLTILIFTKIKFLVYQSTIGTIFQFILVAADVAALLWLWPRITEPDTKWIQWFQARLTKIKNKYTAITVILVLGSICIVFYFSGHTFYYKYKLEERELVHEKPSPEILSAYIDTFREKQFGEVAIVPGSSVWCRYAQPLDLKGRFLIDLKVHLPLGLKGRVFEGADLSSAILCAADFKNATLDDADLYKAKLVGAKFDEARLHNATLDEAILHDAYLVETELHDASLERTELHGANLSRAELHGANLRGAELHGADLRGAELHGANLREAELHGADLRGADFRGVDFRQAEFYGADLTNADLRGADLREAKLYGAKLLRTNIGRYLRSSQNRLQSELESSFLAISFRM